MKNLKSVRLVLASLAIGLFAARASAVVVLPGGLVHAHGTNLAARPELDGVIVADVLRPFSVNNLAFDISGTLQDQVVRTTDGTLSFYTRIFGVQVVRSSGSVPGVDVFVHGGFDSSTVGYTDVDFRTENALGDVRLYDVFRSSGSGGDVSFWPQTKRVQPDYDSPFLFVRTDAKTFDDQGSYEVRVMQGFFSPGDGTAFEDVVMPGFRPTVPEPASIALLGLPALALLRRRRR